MHASRLNQIEIYFSIVQRKMLTPRRRLLAFRRRDLPSEGEELQRDITPTAKENAERCQESEDRVE